jgi:formate C-acetyltransferase
VKSVSALDHTIASNGTLLNMKFTPSTLVGEVGDENFINMMKVYFRRKGFHNQINVISRDLLEDAVKHPEKYKGLIIRVAGYSAFFTELDPSLQQDLINRTELEF